MKHTSHKKTRADVVVENGQLVDIAMMPLEKTNHGGDLARGAWARQGQGELMGAIGGGHAVPWRRWGTRAIAIGAANAARGNVASKPGQISGA